MSSILFFSSFKSFKNCLINSKFPFVPIFIKKSKFIIIDGCALNEVKISLYNLKSNELIFFLSYIEYIFFSVSVIDIYLYSVPPMT